MTPQSAAEIRASSPDDLELFNQWVPSEADEITDPKRYMRNLTDDQLAEEAQRLRGLLPVDWAEGLHG